MTVKILFFSLLREIVGKEEVEPQVSFEPCTVGSILNQVYTQWPSLKDWDSSILISLDLDYVNREVEVVDGQVIVLMSPLQGG